MAADKRDMRIVIRAEDEFSGAMDRASESLGSSASKIKEGIEGVTTSIANLRNELGGMLNEQTALHAISARAGQEFSRVETPSTYGVAGGGGGTEVEGIYMMNEQRLQALREYNGAVLLEETSAAMAKTEVEKRYSDLRMKYAADERDFKIKTAGQSFGAMADLMHTLFTATGTHSKKMFKVMKAFSIAQALMDTYAAFNRALSSLPYPANLAAATTVLAAGMAKVAQIRATKPGGAGSGGGGSGGSAGAAGTQPVPIGLEDNQLQTQHVTINIHNPLSEQNWDAIGEDIVSAINRAGERNVTLTIKTAEA